MTMPPQEDLKSTMRDKTDEELYLLLHVHSQNYTPEAVKVAREEFSQRHLDGQTIDRIVADTEKAQAKSKTIANPQAVTTHTRDSGPEQKLGAGGWLFLIVLCFGVVRGCIGGYDWLDSAGRISHSHSTVISARNDWLVGERKECWSATLDGNDAARLGKPNGYSMSSVVCDDAGPERNMTVTFYGRESQTEYKVVNWLCSRNADSFTCYQAGGVR